MSEEPSRDFTGSQSYTSTAPQRTPRAEELSHDVAAAAEAGDVVQVARYLDVRLGGNLVAAQLLVVSGLDIAPVVLVVVGELVVEVDWLFHLFLDVERDGADLSDLAVIVVASLHFYHLRAREVSAERPGRVNHKVWVGWGGGHYNVRCWKR